jgi:hypothetical protein
MNAFQWCCVSFRYSVIFAVMVIRMIVGSGGYFARVAELKVKTVDVEARAFDFQARRVLESLRSVTLFAKSALYRMNEEKTCVRC